MRKIVILFAVLFSVNAFSQLTPEKMFEYVFKEGETGFYGGVNYNLVNLSFSDWSMLPVNYGGEQLNSVETQFSFGFGAGVMKNYPLNDYVLFRPQLGIAYNKFEFKYDFASGVHTEGVEAITGEFIADLAIKPVDEDLVPSIIVGGSYMYDFNAVNSQNLQLNPSNISVGAGVGFSIKFSNFSLSPVVKYSYGLNNLSGGESNIFNDAISDMKRHVVSLTVYYYK